MNDDRERHRPAGWWAAAIAVTGTCVIGAGAFWLSFTALTDLAALAGIATDQAWVWAVIVDGIIVVSTVAVVSLDTAGRRAVAYPWLLLAASAGVSVLANIVHAIVRAAATLPSGLSGAIAAVPPLVLLAMTHLTVILVRHAQNASDPQPSTEATGVQATSHAEVVETPPIAASQHAVAAPPRARPRPTPNREHRIANALQMHAERMSSQEIAARLGVHRSTVDRWLAARASETEASTAPIGAAETTGATP